MITVTSSHTVLELTIVKSSTCVVIELECLDLQIADGRYRVDFIDASKIKLSIAIADVRAGILNLIVRISQQIICTIEAYYRDDSSKRITIGIFIQHRKIRIPLSSVVSV